ncbi:MAG: DNA mismatch repair endonuclease MutL [Acidobacteria bacterium]|nr:MAG: DNA mismatch repair endonuclease MutL [Acidobacteriota bacterium]
MGRIRVLPQTVADRIAAGEVVERPASVVRELLDNALDAGARRIEVDLVEGGRARIGVADDGCGMDPDDALLAFERHATSKIAAPDDLGAIRSLGFRGEALAAIASVARVELVTSPGEGSEGCRVLFDHGRLVGREPAARARGTTVTVERLFANVPARLKFLKSVGTELEHCLRVCTRSALAHPETGFRVRHAGKPLLVAPPAAGIRERIGDVLGSRWAARLVEGRLADGDLRVQVFAAPADVHRPTRAGLHLFVNRRPVRDPLLLGAVRDAFGPSLPSGRYPVAVVYLEIPPEQVDVNVHPTKTEVRFAEPRRVRGAVVAALRGVLARPDALPRLGPPSASPTGPAAPPAGSGATLWDARAAAPEPPGVAEPPADSVRALAQFRDCYIVAEDAEGLLVVDQHVAHERLLYERLLRDAASGPLPRQVLLFPPTVELGPEEGELVERHAGTLQRIGFRIEPFGDRTVVIREAPQILGSRPVEGPLREVLAALGRGDGVGAEQLVPRLLATIACHAAVKKGMPLTREKMDYLLRGLRCCEVPAHCPHGRAISIRIELDRLERAFGRT